MRISCSAYSSDCIPLPTSRALASVSPPSGASSPGTAAGSGRKAPSIRARRSTSLCDGPLPAGLEALVNPGKILLVEDNPDDVARSEEHTSELQSRLHLVCRLLLEKKKK